MKKVKKTGIGKRFIALLLFLMMCVTLLPANVSVFADTYSQITVNYVVNGITLRTDYLDSGRCVQVANQVPYVSDLVAGTAYEDYKYGTVTNIECLPHQYSPIAPTLYEGQSIDHNGNYSTQTIAYTTSKWEKRSGSDVTEPGRGSARLHAYSVSDQYAVVLNPNDGPLDFEIVEEPTFASYGYQLNWDYNGGTLNGVSSEQESALNQTEDMYTFHYDPATKRPTREGYTFHGWMYIGNGYFNEFTGEVVVGPGEDGDTVSGTMTAQWLANEYVQFRLIFDANGGSNPPVEQIVSLGGEATVAGCEEMVKDEHIFLGWSRDQDATEADIFPGNVLRMDSDITLYAVWKFVEPNTENIQLQKTFVGLEEIPEDFSISWEVVCGSNNASEVLTLDNAESIDEGAMTLTWKVPYFYNIGNDNMVNITENCYVPGYTYVVSSSIGEVRGKSISATIPENVESGIYKITNTYTKLSSEYVTLTYNANGGDPTSVPEPLIAQQGSTYRLSEQTPIREGYEFMGWSPEYLMDLPAMWAIDYDRMLEEDTTIYAIWALKYALKFDINGGKDVETGATGIVEQFVNASFADGNAYEMGVYLEGNYYDLVTGQWLSKWEKDGYAFLGWADTPNATEAQYLNDISVRFTEENPTKTVYAVWGCLHEHDDEGNCTEPDCEHDGKCCVKEFTVTYTDGADGEAFDDQSYTVVEGEPTPAYDGPKTRENYIFVGWDPEFAETVTEDVIYEAVWKDDKNNNGVADEAEPYTITYTDGVENDVVFEDIVIDGLLYGEETPEFGEDPIRDGYTFIRWNPEFADTVTGTVVYTAQWRNNSTGVENPEIYTVKYVDGVDGEAFDEQSYTVEEGMETPEFEFDGDPSRDGYIFTGWNPEVAETVTGSVTYTAQWLKTHTVTWVDANGVFIQDKKDVPDGVDVDDEDYPALPAAPEGKEFDRWEKGEPDENGDIVITVVWKDAEKTYTLSYNATEGTGAPADQSETTAEGSVTFTIAAGVPVREGYTFEGWTEDVRIGTPLYTVGSEITVSEDTTLYAVWKVKEEQNEKTHTVTWVNGYTNTPIKTLPNVKDGQSIASEYPANPTRTGYTFDGWQSGSPDANGNITITATWTRNSNSGGGGSSGGGGGGSRPSGGSAGVSSTGGSSTSGGTTGGGIVNISDPEVPLAAAPGLNNSDHFAYVLGYEDGTVRPENSVSRAEVATIFFRLMTDELRSANLSAENDFSDVDAEAWYNTAVSTCTNAGIINGYEDGTFAPENDITRAEFAAIASRFLGNETPSNSTFDDVAGHWAEAEIGRAVAAGWIRGTGNNSFAPDQCITRAEVMTLVNRMLDRVGDKEAMLDDMVKWSDNPETAWYYADVQEATNGHKYVRDELGVTEIWTELTPNRDWSELER